MAFFAILLSPLVSNSIHASLTPLREAWPEVYWEAPSDYHITLRFLGELAPGEFEHMKAQVAHAVPKFKHYTLQIGQLSFFPPRRDRAVLWAGLRCVPEPLKALASHLEFWARDHGYAPEKRAFVPHITLARCSARDYREIEPHLKMFRHPIHDTWLVERYALMTRWSQHSKGQGSSVYREIFSLDL